MPLLLGILQVLHSPFGHLTSYLFSLNNFPDKRWEKPHLLFGNLLDAIRYLVAWQPLILLVAHLIIRSLDLK